MLSVEQALERMLAAARAIGQSEELPLLQAGGRVLAEAVHARLDVPPMDNSQMDGYAVRCADVASVPARLPVRLRVAAGQAAGELPAGAAARIFTGAAIPAGCDAIVMQEDARVEGDDVVLLRAPQIGQWIRRAGSDIARGAIALPAGQGLRAQHLGIAASLGVARLRLVRRPRVALFCTGDELALPGEAAAPGSIYNSNRFVLGVLLETLGCEVRDLGIVPDTLPATIAVLDQAASDADLVISSGGVSVGEEDHVKAALDTLGQLHLWQIAMKPGKPLAFGQVREIPFIGLPGNPVSAFVTFVLFVRPFLLRCLGVEDVFPKALQLPANFSRAPDAVRREYLRVRRNETGTLDAYSSQNAALLSSVAWADGLAEIAAGASVAHGQPVRYFPLAELLGPP